MVLGLLNSIFGCTLGPAFCSASRHATPWWASSSAAIIPTGPAPTTTTGTLSMRSLTSATEVTHAVFMAGRGRHITCSRDPAPALGESVGGPDRLPDHLPSDAGDHDVAEPADVQPAARLEARLGEPLLVLRTGVDHALA